MEAGTLRGKKIDKEQFSKAIETYYQMMGWDENGIPTTAKLEELDIDWVAEMLKKN
jgi:aldehyde:ferredoxin oxidoreductase